MDRSVVVWDAGSGEEAVVLRGHQGVVRRVAFAPDDRAIASAGDDDQVIIWHAPPAAPDGERPRTLPGDRGSISCLAFHPDPAAHRVAWAGGIGPVTVTDAVTLRELRTFPHDRISPGRVSSLAYGPGGRLLAVGLSSGTALVWDTDTGKLAFPPLVNHPDEVVAVAFDRQGTRLATVAGFRVWIWNTATGEPVGHPLEGHADLVWAVAFAPDGRSLASASSDQRVGLWDLDTGAVEWLAGHDEPVKSVAYSGQRLVSGGHEHDVRFWDLTTRGQATVADGGPLIGATDLAFSPDSRYLAGACRDGTVRVWSAADGRALCALYGHYGRVLAVAFDPGGKELASAGIDGSLKFWGAAAWGGSAR
jgi:WD40 repeat protein